MLRKALLVVLLFCCSPSVWSRGGPPQLLKAYEADLTCEYVTGKDVFGRVIRTKSHCREFEKSTGFPKGRDGYIVIYKKALECGGENASTNMQWVPVQTAKALVQAMHKCNGTTPSN
jgi:hypothetical protein